MKINVKTLQGSDCYPVVSEETSVHELKCLVSAEMDVPVERQRLMFKGKAMQDEMTLKQCGVTPESKVFLSLKDSLTSLASSGRYSTASSRESSESRSTASHASSAGHLAACETSSAGRSASEASGAGSCQSELHQRLVALLHRHYSPADAERVAQEFQRELHSQVARMSLDDIERIAKANLQQRK